MKCSPFLYGLTPDQFGLGLQTDWFSTLRRTDLRNRKMPRQAKLARKAKENAAHRSWTMAQVKSKNTTPEMTVRKAAHALGLRFRLHRRDLPGTPDLVFPSRQTAVFVHGCFWHRHGCRRATTPVTNVGYWSAKFDRNVQRDVRNVAELRKLGWRCVRIWECETKDANRLADIVLRKIIAKTRKGN
jgi:DNA mismatch endonuclease, patch repair protein